MTHELKIWPQYFCRVADGTKTFEIRENDRGFQPGDTVVLKEWDKRQVRVSAHHEDEDRDGYTGYKLKFKIGYLLPIDATRVVFSLLPYEETRE